MPSGLNIGLICTYNRRNAKTITDHISALLATPHNTSILRAVYPPIAWKVDLDIFDVLIVHYDVVASSDNYIPPSGRRRIAAFKGLKIIFIQDEYRFVDKTVEAINGMGFHVLFTCVPEQEIEKVYPRDKLPGLRKVNVLTGYVPAHLLGRVAKPYEERAIDVGYRSRKVPTWLGALGAEKWRIVDRFRADAARWGLNIDLSCREEDRIYGEDWHRFIENCKAMLGTESGASVFDFSGDIQTLTEAYERDKPTAPFEEVSDKCFSHLEGRVRLNQISPRCFEAACLRTLMILYEGEYSGVLRPWRHYVPLKKDHSNIAEVVAALRDPALAGRITAAAYEEICCDPALSYSALTSLLARVIGEEFKPEMRGKGARGLGIRLALTYALVLSRTLAERSAYRFKCGVTRLLVKILLFSIGTISNRRATPPIDMDDALAEAPQALLDAWVRFKPLLVRPAKDYSGADIRRRKSIIFLEGARSRRLGALAQELRQRGWDALTIGVDQGGGLHGDITKTAGAKIRLDPIARESRMRRLATEIAKRFAMIVTSESAAGAAALPSRNLPPAVAAHRKIRKVAGTLGQQHLPGYRALDPSPAAISQALLGLSENGSCSPIWPDREDGAADAWVNVAADRLEERYDDIVRGHCPSPFEPLAASEADRR